MENNLPTRVSCVRPSGRHDYTAISYGMNGIVLEDIQMEYEARPHLLYDLLFVEENSNVIKDLCAVFCAVWFTGFRNYWQ